MIVVTDIEKISSKGVLYILLLKTDSEVEPHASSTKLSKVVSKGVMLLFHQSIAVDENDQEGWYTVLMRSSWKKKNHIIDGTNDVSCVSTEANWTIEATVSIVVRRSKDIRDVEVKWRSMECSQNVSSEADDDRVNRDVMCHRTMTDLEIARVLTHKYTAQTGRNWQELNYQERSRDDTL